MDGRRPHAVHLARVDFSVASVVSRLARVERHRLHPKFIVDAMRVIRPNQTERPFKHRFTHVSFCVGRVRTTWFRF